MNILTFEKISITMFIIFTVFSLLLQEQFLSFMLFLLMHKLTLFSELERNTPVQISQMHYTRVQQEVHTHTVQGVLKTSSPERGKIHIFCQVNQLTSISL